MGTDTLVIKHLPATLAKFRKVELMKKLGAVEVKCIDSAKNKYNVVFARFASEQAAELCLQRLHQLEIGGKLLTVEFAKTKPFESPPTQELPQVENEAEQNNKVVQKFIEKLNSWHSGLDFQQPVPHHLKYQYPPPNEQVLRNIAKVLLAVPKFYTQVLHLMNRMNMPCPFGKDLLPDLPFLIDVSCKDAEIRDETSEEPTNVIEGVQEEEEESELSSDEEVKKQKEIIPVKQKTKKKVIKVPKFVKPVKTCRKITKKTLFEEVFEAAVEEAPSKKPKLSHPPSTPLVEHSKEENTDPSSAGFGYFYPSKSDKEEETVETDTRDPREEERLEKEVIVKITSKELASNRISEQDRSVLSVFKNYAEGAPTCRLYLKNLAKGVTEDDLRYIYSRYRVETIREPNMFDIRLMQEGRMKGQAFVTLQTIALAQQALKETCGFILKDRPIVVQFARSAT